MKIDKGKNHISLQFGNKKQPKYFSIVYGKYWEKPDYSFSKTPLGWSLNIHKLSFSYDDYDKVIPKFKDGTTVKVVSHRRW